MKLINKLDETIEKSLYSGQTFQNTEMYIRPIPKVDSNGVQLKPVQRYYVFRLLNFQNEDRNYPFIVRNEHEFYKKDASGKILEVKRICCPTTPWAKNKINEAIGKDYCPLCKLSFDQNGEAWKNFKNSKQVDTVCLQLSKDTARRWAVYIPVLVVSDPAYPKNNNHLRVLRLSGTEGQSTFNRIRELIKTANEDGISVFNGEEGANIAILCEKQTKIMVNKKNEPVIDPKTGKERTYMINAVTDVKLLKNRLHSYPSITEVAIEKLHFDDNYGVAATRDQLTVFMNENYLDTGASDADFNSEFDDDFSEPSVVEEPKEVTTTYDEPVGVVDGVTEEEDVVGDTTDGVFDDSDLDEDEESSPDEMIAKITKGKLSASNPSGIKMQKTATLPPETDKLRNESASFSDDDFPF